MAGCHGWLQHISVEGCHTQENTVVILSIIIVLIFFVMKTTLPKSHPNIHIAVLVPVPVPVLVLAYFAVIVPKASDYLLLSNVSLFWVYHWRNIGFQRFRTCSEYVIQKQINTIIAASKKSIDDKLALAFCLNLI